MNSRQLGSAGLAAMVLLVVGCSGEEKFAGGGAACDFGEIFTTDGRIPELELEVVDDPGVFILYNASLTMPRSVYDQAPEAFETIVELVLEPLGDESMAELNRQVASEDVPASEVAAGYLDELGIREELAALDLSGVEASVGSKDFVEQFVLGEVILQALDATGAETRSRVNLGTTSENRDALLSGDIDMYWEYNGTGWTVHLGQEEPSDDPDTLTEAVREMDGVENDIAWVGRSPFNNTYGFATSKEFADAEGPFDLQAMADHMEEHPDTRLCVEREFPDRPDGLVLFEEATGYDVPDTQIVVLDSGVIYEETANNR